MLVLSEVGQRPVSDVSRPVGDLSATCRRPVGDLSATCQYQGVCIWSPCVSDLSISTPPGAPNAQKQIKERLCLLTICHFSTSLPAPPQAQLLYPDLDPDPTPLTLFFFWSTPPRKSLHPFFLFFLTIFDHFRLCLLLFQSD